MSQFEKNELAIFLRPAVAIPPYQVNNCARWLVSEKKFQTYDQARTWLNLQETTNSDNFKYIMGQFYIADNTRSNYTTTPEKNVNDYHTSKNNGYGEEAHMWFIG
jgi:hypothetical protein